MRGDVCGHALSPPLSHIYPDSYTVVARGVADLYISLTRTHNPKYARSGYHTQLAKMSFDKIFDLTAGVYDNFYNI